MSARTVAAAVRSPEGTLRNTWTAFKPAMGTELLVLCCSVFFAVFSNAAFWSAAITDLAGQWRFVISLFLVITGLHAFLLGLVVTRWNAKPLLSVLLLVTALASHYMSAYGVYLDADMLRNVLHTDRRESAELMTSQLLLPILLTLPALAVLWRVQLRRRARARAVGLRLLFLLAMVATAAAGAWFSSQDLSSLIRSHREVRYLVTPANYVIALGKVMIASPPGPKRASLPVGLDATRAPRKPGKPRLLVLVIGETARAQNWGLNGYARQTTPELAQVQGLINFPQVTACGSSTEVSLPCMFSPFGRSDYDEDKIRSHQSLLHVLDHAGIGSLWRDNQSGCKGVCDGLPVERLDESKDAALCNGKRCLDMILLKDLEAKLHPEQGDQVVVMHQLGNHGPSYFERYPPQFRRFTPTCDNPELGQCDKQAIVNAYDNALLYTDHFLASTIGFLKGQAAFDTALIYVSDHGESLGEKGMFLHGVPYAIAPQEQIHVPMVMWFSPGFADASGLDTDCLRQRARQPASHDNLFATVLGLLQVQTREYRQAEDLSVSCRARETAS